jgi:hypothetical protein
VADPLVRAIRKARGGARVAPDFTPEQLEQIEYIQRQVRDNEAVPGSTPAPPPSSSELARPIGGGGSRAPIYKNWYAKGGGVDNATPPRELNDQGLYSHAAETAETLPMEAAPPAQYRGMLLKRPGVSEEELNWSGYDQAFAGKKEDQQARARAAFPPEPSQDPGNASSSRSRCPDQPDRSADGCLRRRCVDVHEPVVDATEHLGI